MPRILDNIDLDTERELLTTLATTNPLANYFDIESFGPKGVLKPRRRH